MDKKYEMLKDDFIELTKYDSMGRPTDIKLHRIRALNDFSNVYKGDLGGYIEKEDNLSQEGICWVYGDSMVYDNACISEDACIFNDSKICDEARIYGDALVSASIVYSSAKVYGHASVSDDSEIYGNAKVYGYACVHDSAIHGDAEVYDDASIYNTILNGKCKIHGDSLLQGSIEVYGNTETCGYATIKNGIFNNDAIIESNSDYCFISGFGSASRSTTFYKCKDGSIKVNCGCFNGTLDEFRSKVKETHKDNDYAVEYLTIADLVEKRLSKK